ncbi:MAG: B12-binding domain-containing radical SAM protein [Promethearchaeota archaeon]
MRIILISPNIPRNVLGTISPWEVPALNLGYLGAVLKQNHHEVEIVDALIGNLSLNQVGEIVEVKDPGLVGITVNAFSAKYAIRLAQYLKRRHSRVPVVMGGVFPTATHEYLLEHDIADYVVVGEGELTLLELVDAIEGNRDPGSVDGLAFKRDGRVHLNKPRELIQDLDSLPFPAWDLYPTLKPYVNLRGVLKTPYLPVFTSRGCPYGCVWCAKNIHGRKIRYRSPQNVVAEIERDIEEFGIREIVIMDDSFSQNRARAIEICRLIIQKDLRVNINLYSGVRADRLDEIMLKFFKRAGVKRITVGIESGNQKVVNLIGKRLNLRKASRISRVIKRLGFIFDAFFMLGLPYDTEQTMEQTIQFARALDPHHAYFFITTPFVGTDLYELARKNDWLLHPAGGDTPHHIVQGFVSYVTENFTEEQVAHKFKQAYRRFYFNARKIASLVLLYSKLIVKYRSLPTLRWLVSQGLFLLEK